MGEGKKEEQKKEKKKKVVKDVGEEEPWRYTKKSWGQEEAMRLCKYGKS